MAGSEQGRLFSMTSGEPSRQSSREIPARKPLCRYFHTQSGCRKGNECPFRHDIALSTQKQDVAPFIQANDSSRNKATDLKNSAAARTIDVHPSMVVTKPVTKLERENPRAYQIQQIKKRFPTTEEEPGSEESTVLNFDMDPSDPDFPFDIGKLKCAVRVPADFPYGNPPTLRIKNPNMERGYQINVENWFSTAWSQTSHPTLFGVVKSLDRRLEEILTAKKSDTITLVPNFPVTEFLSKPLSSSKVPETTPAVEPPSQPVEPQLSRGDVQTKPSSSQQVEEARKKRQGETQVLEHRLRTLHRFSRSNDGTEYMIPLEPRKRNDMPGLLKSIDSIRLFVPSDYGLTACSIKLHGVDNIIPGVSSVESGFRQHAEEQKHLSLLSHINWLAQNMHSLANLPPAVDSQDQKTIVKIENVAKGEVRESSNLEAASIGDEPGKGHIKYIPRPPEWLEPIEIESDDSNYLSSSSKESEVKDRQNDSDDDQNEVSEGTGAVREKGILLSFPHLELYGIELLELVSINIAIKCSRCKDTSDVNKIQNHEPNGYAGLRSGSCRKCSFTFGIAYRKDLMHSNSVRAGYLDMDGCTPVDLLPSIFIPTCSGCSTPYPGPGIISVREDASIAICRECHQKMTFKLTEVKFLHVGVAGVRAPKGLPRKKMRESLGIAPGHELPNRGKCKHYGKSYRWFRFSCCSKVYPCDKCHDETAPDHPNEFATRMICGYCSREQNYRPEDCGFCRAGLTGKAGTGFWEGGKGTRDPMRMSRKDPRKYKRRPGNKSGT